MVVGQYTDVGGVEINPHWDLNRKHLEVRGCWGSDFSHFYRGCAWWPVTAIRFPWDRLISAEYSLDQAGQALADVESLKVVKALIRP